MQPARSQVEGVGANPVNFENVETVIATVKGVYTGPGRMTVDISAEAIINSEAGSKELILRVRREGVAGPLVEKVEVKLVASVNQSISVQCEDTPGEVAGLTYVLTAADSVAAKDKSLASKITATF